MDCPSGCQESDTTEQFSLSDNHFAFLLFFFFGMVLFAASYTILQTSIRNFSGTLLTSSNPLNLFVTSTAYS